MFHPFSSHLNSEKLDKTGGTLSGTSSTILSLDNIASGAASVYMKFLAEGKQLGWFGFNSLNEAVLSGKSGETSTLHHSSNKPLGTYTGNGSATSRTIATGGIGNAIVVFCYSLGALAFISGTGAIYKLAASAPASVTRSSVYYENGNLVITSAENFINKADEIYYYQVL